MSRGAQVAKSGLSHRSDRCPANGWTIKFSIPKTVLRKPASPSERDNRFTISGKNVGKSVGCRSFRKCSAETASSDFNPFESVSSPAHSRSFLSAPLLLSIVRLNPLSFLCDQNASLREIHRLIDYTICLTMSMLSPAIMKGWE